MTSAEKAANALKLAQRSRKDAATYRAKGNMLMAAHHSLKAREWLAAAKTHRENANITRRLI